MYIYNVIYITYIYTKVSGSEERLVHANLELSAFSALVAHNCSKSPSARPEPLRAAQTRSERAQGRSEPPRAFAQSCSRNRSESPRAAQRRPERSLRVAQSAPRAAPSEEPLRIARSVPRAAQSRSELLEKPIGELGVTCTLHIRCSVLLHLVPSSPCMYMHGFALVYIYIYIYP